MQSPDFLNSVAGFEEVEHTADWAYRVWGQNLAELFIQAANGLYAIASVQLATDSPISRNIQLHGVDHESLLVAWLNELLYLHESEGLGFNQFEILHLDRQNLQAKVSGATVKNWNKLIKAVTYNNLAIQTTEKGLEATLVLDV
jgi:SHS2 domain-containing protein